MFEYTDKEYNNFHKLYIMRIIQFDFWSKYSKEYTKRKKKKVIDKIKKEVV